MKISFIAIKLRSSAGFQKGRLPFMGLY